MEYRVHAFKGGRYRTRVRHVAIKDFHFGRERFCKSVARQRKHPDIYTTIEEFTAKRPPHDPGAARYKRIHQVSSM